MSFNTISQWLELNSKLLIGATWETLYMVAVAGIVGFAVGIPLGVILHTTKKGGLLENTKLNGVLGAIVNIGRSVPFLVLMVAIIPVTKLLVGTFIGTTAAIVPLTIAAPILGVLLQLQPAAFGAVIVTLALGTPALSIIGTFGAALTVGVRRGGLLLSLLVLPLYVPTLIFGAEAVRRSADGLDATTPLLMLAGITAGAVALLPFATAAVLRMNLR